MGKIGKAFADALALSGIGKAEQAREQVIALKALVVKVKAASKEPMPFDQFVEVADGMVSLAEGRTLEGQRALLNAAALEDTNRELECTRTIHHTIHGR